MDRSRIRRKAKKLSLAYEYVHGRFSLIPSYSDLVMSVLQDLWAILRFALIGTLAFIIVFLLSAITPKAIFFITSHLPKPAPVVTAHADVESANVILGDMAREEWLIALATLPMEAVSAAQSTHLYLRENPDIFDILIPVKFAGVREFQEELSRPFQSVSLEGANTLRIFMIPFTIGMNEFPSRLDAEVALLKRLNNFNETNIRSYLDTTADRSLAIEEYLATGKNLRESATRTYYNLVSRRQVAERNYIEYQTKANEEEKRFLADLNAYASNQAEESFTSFVATKSKAVDFRAQGGFLLNLEKRYTYEIKAVDLKMNAIEMNREALIADVTVTPVNGIDLGLISQ